MEGKRNGSRGIQSVEVGGRLLLALAHHGGPLPLKELSREANMSPAKAHPYLVSFGKLGLIEQDGASGRYGLGPLALQLGLLSLQQYDPVRLATPLLPDLAREIGHTVAIAVWGNRGPTIVRIEEAPSLVHVNMRHGTVMSLRGTASGRLFAAYRSPAQVETLLQAEERSGRRAAARTRTQVNAQFEADLSQVRERGLSVVVDGAVAGVSAMAAPVFDATGEMVLSLTAIGPGRVFDIRPRGPVACALRRCAQYISRQLGAPATADAAGAKTVAAPTGRRCAAPPFRSRRAAR